MTQADAAVSAKIRYAAPASFTACTNFSMPSFSLLPKSLLISITCYLWNCGAAANACLDLFTRKSCERRIGRLSACVLSACHMYSRLFKPAHELLPIRFYLQLCAHLRTPTVTYRGVHSHILQ